MKKIKRTYKEMTIVDKANLMTGMKTVKNYTEVGFCDEKNNLEFIRDFDYNFNCVWMEKFVLTSNELFFENGFNALKSEHIENLKVSDIPYADVLIVKTKSNTYAYRCNSIPANNEAKYL